MKHTAAFLVGTLAVVTAVAPSAMAAPKKKPITGSYTAKAAVPDQTNLASVATGGYSSCGQTVPGSYDEHAFKIPAKGALHVDLTDFHGDWDLLIEDSDKSELAVSGNNPETPEAVDLTFKKAQSIFIVACNFAGTPTGKVSYSFTFK
jgi:hypothetical protein